METGEISAKKENKKNIDLSAVTFFVIENIPDIAVLKEIAEKEKEETLLIGDNRWNLRVFEDEGFVSSGKKGNIKEIILYKETSGKKAQFGIVVEEDFGLVLGSIVGDSEFRFDQPVNFREITDELKKDNIRRIKESMVKTHSQSETAVELNLRPEYVSQIISRPIPQKQ